MTTWIDYIWSYHQGDNAMKTMAVSQFKAHALRTLGEVSTSRESVLITKRGKPLARVVPIDDAQRGRPGRLADAFVDEHDIVSPLGAEAWEANR
jgi:prevent-host-death family protein